MKTRDYYWTAQLVERDRKLFIRSEIIRYGEPMMDILYWPVSHVTAGFERSELPLPAHSLGSEHGYSIRREKDLDKVVCGYDAHFNVYLPDGGRTKAEFVETVSIDCPKVRKGIETRWRNGSWEKCLKSGWVSA